MPNKVITALIDALNNHRNKWGDHSIVTNTHLLEILQDAQNELGLQDYDNKQRDAFDNYEGITDI